MLHYCGQGGGRPTALHTQYYTTLHYTTNITNILLKTTGEHPSWSKIKNKKINVLQLGDHFLLLPFSYYVSLYYKPKKKHIDF